MAHLLPGVVTGYMYVTGGVDAVDASLVEDLIVEIWKAKTVASVTFQLVHDSGVRLIDCGAERQNVQHSREHHIIVICIDTDSSTINQSIS